MGIRGSLQFIYHRLFEFAIIIALVLFVPNIPPHTSFSESLRLPSTKPLEGKLALNGKLDDFEIWHKGRFTGPESLASHDGELYTGLQGGDIFKLTGNHLSPIAKTGKPCRFFYEERTCGRPQGLRFNKQGTLYVADAYYGIMTINIHLGNKQVLVSPQEEIEGKKPKIFNSLAIASNGDIFWTDSSSEFFLDDALYDFLADPSGRLIQYNSKTKSNKVLIDKLRFANGVALSDDEDFLIVAECTTSRIHRYYLKGPKAGTHDIFIEGLPGLLDNLNTDGHGGFLVPLVSPADAENPNAVQVLLPFPLIRKFLARIIGVTHSLFKTWNRFFPSDFTQQTVNMIGNLNSVSGLFPSPRTTILHLSKSGEILDSLHTTNKTLSYISEAHIFKNTLYLGSPYQDYIARIPLSKIGWEHLSK
ncbi:hypothetical protein JTB14_016541 [Gonioctena quinquepunctata]|nr:hypothetical protein JTB14_016541 [Gonioctena quinquepunctata]